jgi:hypothetical protein
MRTTTFLALLLTSFLFSCSKDEGGSNILGVGELSMKINGTQWSGTVITNVIDEKTEQIAISSVNTSANETMGIVIDDFKGVGTYPIPGDNITSALYLRKDKVLFTTGKEISYKVTSISSSLIGKSAHGTFSGTIKSTSGEVLTITDGKF